MQTVNLNQKITKGRLQAYTSGDVSLSSLMPSLHVEEGDAARVALEEAEEVIRGQEQRIQELENLVLTDELTGIYNRRGFMTMLDRELSYAKRDPKASGVLIVTDLDGFKSVNDVWGHSAGDSYLKAAASSLRATTRSNDFVARLGGDEFAVILTRINSKDGALRTQEIGRDFNCQVTEWHGFAMPLRASFGMACFSGHEGVEELMAEADMKLYVQKKMRRGEKNK